MRRGVLLGFACFAAYAVSDAFVKSLEGSLPAFEAVAFGALFGLLALPFVRAPGDRLLDACRAQRPWLWWTRAVTGAVGGVTAVIAFTRLSMAETFALIFLMPIFVTLLSVLWLKEHVGWRRWLAVVAGFVGVLVVLRPGFRALGTGHLAALVCGLAGAVSLVAMRSAGGREKAISLYGAGVIGPLLAGLVLMAPGFVWPDGRQWGLLAGYGLLAGLAGVLLMVALRHAPAARVAPTQYSQMLWAIGFGYVLFDNPLDTTMALGIAIILGAGLFTLAREEKVTTHWRRTRIV